MHPDMVWIVSQADTDLGALGKNDGILEAAQYLGELAKSQPERPEFTRGVTDTADAVRDGTENDDWYRKDAAPPDGLSFNPGLLIAALNDAREQLHTPGHTAAVELARSWYDECDEASVEDPDRENYWEDEDTFDEETFRLDSESYAEAREYLAGVAFAAGSLVVRFQVDPDPSWEPS